MKIQNVAVQLQLGDSLIKFYTEQSLERQSFEGMCKLYSQWTHQWMHHEITNHNLCFYCFIWAGGKSNSTNYHIYPSSWGRGTRGIYGWGAGGVTGSLKSLPCTLYPVILPTYSRLDTKYSYPILDLSVNFFSQGPIFPDYVFLDYHILDQNSLILIPYPRLDWKEKQCIHFWFPGIFIFK